MGVVLSIYIFLEHINRFCAVLCWRCIIIKKTEKLVVFTVWPILIVWQGSQSGRWKVLQHISREEWSWSVVGLPVRTVTVDNARPLDRCNKAWTIGTDAEGNLAYLFLLTLSEVLSVWGITQNRWQLSGVFKRFVEVEVVEGRKREKKKSGDEWGSTVRRTKRMKSNNKECGDRKWRRLCRRWRSGGCWERRRDVFEDWILTWVDDSEWIELAASIEEGVAEAEAGTVTKGED